MLEDFTIADCQLTQNDQSGLVSLEDMQNFQSSDNTSPQNNSGQNHLPCLELEDWTTDFAARTNRNNGSGESINERDALLDRMFGDAGNGGASDVQLAGRTTRDDGKGGISESERDGVLDRRFGQSDTGNDIVLAGGVNSRAGKENEDDWI